MWCVLLITGHLPTPKPRRKDSSRVMPAICYIWWGCCSRTLLQTCKLPQALNYWCLCQGLQTLSLVLKLGKYRPCRSAGAVQQNYYEKWRNWTSSSLKFHLAIYYCIISILRYIFFLTFNFSEIRMCLILTTASVQLAVISTYHCLYISTLGCSF